MLLASLLLATSVPSCAPQHFQLGRLTAQRIQSRRCIVMVSGNEDGPRARTYLFSNNGSFMVFNDFGSTGSSSRDTGARTYFTFPALGMPEIQAPREGDTVLTVRLASGAQIEFSAETGRLVAIEGMLFSEDPVISGDNEGGVELRPFDGAMLDTGWAVGRPAYTARDGVSRVLRWEPAAKCEVPNSELFAYDVDPYDPPLKITSEESWKELVARRCQGF